MIIPRGSCKCLIEKALTRASLAFLWRAALSRCQAALGETPYVPHPPPSGVKHGYTECVGFPVCHSDCPVEPPDCFKEPSPMLTKFPRIWELDHDIGVFQSPRGCAAALEPLEETAKAGNHQQAEGSHEGRGLLVLGPCIFIFTLDFPLGDTWCSPV